VTFAYFEEYCYFNSWPLSPCDMQTVLLISTFIKKIIDYDEFSFYDRKNQKGISCTLLCCEEMFNIQQTFKNKRMASK